MRFPTCDICGEVLNEAAYCMDTRTPLKSGDTVYLQGRHRSTIVRVNADGSVDYIPLEGVPAPYRGKTFTTDANMFVKVRLTAEQWDQLWRA